MTFPNDARIFNADEAEAVLHCKSDKQAQGNQVLDGKGVRGQVLSST